MASLTGQIRAKLKAILEALSPSIGIVHDYERWAVEEAAFRDLLVDPGSATVRAWTITREAAAGERQPPANALRTWTFVVRGFRAHNDALATEKAFDDDVEVVQDALGADITLGGLADATEEPQVRIIEPRTVAGMLVHYAEISVKVQVSKTY